MDVKSVIGVIAAHPDDEVLGCGATIARHAAQGDAVHVLILAEGLTSRSAQRDISGKRAALGELAEQAQRAGDALGVSSVRTHGFPDNRMDSLPLLDVVKIVEDFIAEHGPGTVYTHFGGDLNVDHRIVHEAVKTACRPQVGMSVRTLLFMEVPSSTEWQIPAAGGGFVPDWYVDVSASLERKLAALHEYDSEMRPWPHPRSYEGVTHLARWRGATVGCAAAEAFMLGRRLS